MIPYKFTNYGIGIAPITMFCETGESESWTELEVERRLSLKALQSVISAYEIATPDL